MSSLSRKARDKAARIIALSRAINEGLIDLDAVNQSEVARIFGVDRSTIHRDLSHMNGMIRQSIKYYDMLQKEKDHETD